MKVKKVKNLILQVRETQTEYTAKRVLDEVLRVIEAEDRKSKSDKKGKDKKKKDKDKKDKKSKSKSDKDLTIGQMIDKMKNVGSESK